MYIFKVKMFHQEASVETIKLILTRVNGSACLTNHEAQEDTKKNLMVLEDKIDGEMAIDIPIDNKNYQTTSF